MIALQATKSAFSVSSVRCAVRRVVPAASSCRCISLIVNQQTTGHSPEKSPFTRPFSSLLERKALHRDILGINNISWLSTTSAGEAVDESDVEQQSSALIHKPIRILFGSQGGTAQLFSMQLADAIAEVNPDREVSTLGLHESSTPAQILDTDALHIILVSVTGVGEPPDNARAFYEWLTSDDKPVDEVDWPSVNYAVFGLGNQKAHPNHYNVIGKKIDSCLEQLGAKRIHETGLGDDGDCIEDDFDLWVESILTTLTTATTAEKSSDQKEEETVLQVSQEAEALEDLVYADDDKLGKDYILQDCPGASSESGKRRVSVKYPALLLQSPETDVVRGDLFHLAQGTSEPFYSEDTMRLSILGNGAINANGGEHALREMRISLGDHPEITYEAGDHLALYPRNAECIVDAYLQLLDVNPHAIIVGEDPTATKPYPLPTGLTVKETLTHCVDLGAVPSPAFARAILGRKDVNYKEEISNPRRTVLDTMCEAGYTPSLEELLYNLPPMQSRYYSIASSPLETPREIFLTYRPVKYVTNRGVLREGVATSYMSALGVVDDGIDESHHSSFVAAAVKSNPTFRLPHDLSTPILLVAGGCGVAPIRSFLEERISYYQKGTKSADFGEAHLFLGFRNPADEVYQSLVKRALDCGAITQATISYTSGCTASEQNCGLVSDTVRQNGKLVYDLMEQGGYVYLCGGARTFGVAIENEVIKILQEQGDMSLDDATKYLQDMIHEGRLCEDLAD